MDGKVLDSFLAFLKSKPANIRWAEGHEIAYEIGLEEIPNEAFRPLVKAVNDECKFRPEVSEIKTLWRRINGTERNWADLLGEVRTAARGGLNQKPHPTHRNFFEVGPPPNLSAGALREIECLGGWNAFATSAQEIPSGVWLGQVSAVCRTSSEGATDDRLRQIGASYRTALFTETGPRRLMEDVTNFLNGEDEQDEG